MLKKNTRIVRSSFPFTRTQKGVALLMALSLVLFLTIFLARNFEETRTDLKLLKNEEQKFEINTISLSITKAILLAINERGANYVYDFLSLLGKIPDFPITLTDALPNLAIYNPKIWSMDHYFYVPRSFTGNDNHRRILERILKQSMETYLDDKGTKPEKEIPYGPVIGLVHDWMDQDKNQTRGRISGKEQIDDFDIPVQAKNSPLETPSEFKFLLLNALKEEDLTLEKDFFETLPIRFVTTKGVRGDKFSNDETALNPCFVGKLNLNMLPKIPEKKEESLSTVSDFLNWFGNHSDSKCKRLTTVEDEILDKIESKFFPEGEELVLFESIGNNQFKPNLSDFGVSLNDAKRYFKGVSNLIGMSFEIQNGDLRATVTLQAYLQYQRNTTKDKPEKIYLISYQVQ